MKTISCVLGASWQQIGTSIGAEVAIRVMAGSGVDVIVSHLGWDPQQAAAAIATPSTPPDPAAPSNADPPLRSQQWLIDFRLTSCHQWVCGFDVKMICIVFQQQTDCPRLFGHDDGDATAHRGNRFARTQCIYSNIDLSNLRCFSLNCLEIFARPSSGRERGKDPPKSLNFSRYK